MLLVLLLPLVSTLLHTKLTVDYAYIISNDLFNQQIRARALWMEDELSSGDLLMVVKNNYFWLGDKDNRFIANGDTIRVVRVNYIEDKFGFKFADCEVTLSDQIELGELNVKLLLNSIDADGPSISRNDSSLLYRNLRFYCL